MGNLNKGQDATYEVVSKSHMVTQTLFTLTKFTHISNNTYRPAYANLLMCAEVNLLSVHITAKISGKTKYFRSPRRA